jgi:hypothetical protein
MRGLRFNSKAVTHMAHNEKFSVHRKTIWGTKFVCYCDEVHEKDGVFSFVDKTQNEVQAILNKSEFAYATRNY